MSFLERGLWDDRLFHFLGVFTIDVGFGYFLREVFWLGWLFGVQGVLAVEQSVVLVLDFLLHRLS